MSQNLFALLVHDESESFVSLEQALRELPIEICSVETCKEAEDLIARREPYVIFTEPALRDGSWESVLNISESADVALDVIVVGSQPDTGFHVSVSERGAFDFVLPPLEYDPLGFVEKSAEIDLRRRRGAKAHETDA